jgi:hypothetical protein
VVKKPKLYDSAKKFRLLSYWLLGGYLLPFTIWQRLSVVTVMNWLREVMLPSANLFVVLGILTWATLRLICQSEWRLWHKLLVAATSIYACVYGIDRLISSHVTHALDPVMVPTALVMGLAAASCCRSALDICTVVSKLAIYQVICAVLQAFLGKHLLWSGSVARLGGTGGQPLLLYPIILLALPLVFSIASLQKVQWRQWMWHFWAILMCLALLFTWERGAVIAVTISGSWYCWALSRSKKSLVLAISVLVACCFFTFWIRSSGAKNHDSLARSNSGHVFVTRLGWDSFLRHPLTGVGAGQLALPVQVAHAGKERTIYYNECENLPIQWLAEMGIGGGLLLVLFASCLYGILAQSKDKLAIAISASWVGLLVAGFFDMPFGYDLRLPSTALVGALIGASMMIRYVPVRATSSLPFAVPSRQDAQPAFE